MATDDGRMQDGAPRTHGAARPHSQLFALRLWQEEVAGGWQVRGSIREVLGGAFASFLDWSDLVAFLIARLEENGSTAAQPPQDANDHSDESGTTNPSRR